MWVGAARAERGRAVSPVIGIALLLAVVVGLAVVSGVIFFNLAEEQPTAPEASLDLVPIDGSGDYRLVHESGAEIDGDRLRLKGAEDPDALAGTTFGAGDEVRLTPKAEEIEVVWSEQQSGGGTAYVLSTFDVDAVTFTGTLAGGGTLQSRVSGQANAIQGDGGSLDPLGSTGNEQALGPATEDLDGDGVLEVPYIGSGGDLKTVDSDGDTKTLATDGDVSGDIETSNTRLGVGTWDGSDPSVFFAAGSSDSEIYRVAPGGTPTRVATLDNGADAVAGVGDIDGDGTDELVFADGSQTVRYVEPSDPDSGSFTAATTGQSLGSSNGIGLGGLFDADGDGQERVVAINSGDIYLVDSSGSDEITSGDVNGGNAPDAKQSPATVADVDGDDKLELVYLGNDDGKIKYLDGFEGYVTSGTDMDKKFLKNDSGNKIDGAIPTGVTS